MDPYGMARPPKKSAHPCFVLGSHALFILAGRAVQCGVQSPAQYDLLARVITCLVSPLEPTIYLLVFLDNFLKIYYIYMKYEYKLIFIKFL